MYSFPTPSTLLRASRRLILPVLLTGVVLAATAQPNYTVTTDGAIPAGTYNNVVVSSNRTATITGVVTVTGRFTVQGNATLVLGDNDYIAGNNFVLNNDGRLRLQTVGGIDGTTSGPIRTVNKSFGTKGRFSFNNSSFTQSTGPSFPDEVSELEISNSSAGGVNLTKPLRVRERLYLRAGVLHTNGHELLLISRTPDIAMVTAASCVVFQEDGSVDGQVRVQRYINPRFNAGLGYRHVSSSVSGNTWPIFRPRLISMPWSTTNTIWCPTTSALSAVT